VPANEPYYVARYGTYTWLTADTRASLVTDRKLETCHILETV